MSMNLAEQLREVLEARREFKKLEPHVRAGVIMVRQLRTHLMVYVNRVDDINHISYDIGNPTIGNLASVMSEAGVTPRECQEGQFRRLFTQYVEDAMEEEGIAIRWLPHELRFAFIGYGDDEA